MNATNARARYGMTAKIRPSSVGTSGLLTIGQADSDLTLSANKPYALRAIMPEGSSFAFDLLDPAAGFTNTWVAGTAQVETATAAGTVTTAGNATVTVTAAGMTGSPKAITVAVALDDTADLWAAKVRTALAADADVSALFTVSGSTTAIVLTRKTIESHTVPDGFGSTTSLYFYAANDGTLNIALADDTSVGITEAASSANTTAGVATSGAKIYTADGADFEGTAIPALTSIPGLLITAVYGITTYASGSGDSKGILWAAGDGSTTVMQLGSDYDANAMALYETDLTFTAIDGTTDITINVFGYLS